MTILEASVEPVIKAIHAAYAGHKVERARLTGIAVAVGLLPEVRRMVCQFNDRQLYPERPMITLHEACPSIYLLGWREGDWTDIHDHGECQVGLHVVQGMVTEDLYAASSVPSSKDLDVMLAFSRHLRQGDTVTCPRKYIHRIGNMFPEVAATVHVYGPTLNDMNLFKLDGARLQFDCHWHDEHQPQH